MEKSGTRGRGHTPHSRSRLSQGIKEGRGSESFLAPLWYFWHEQRLALGRFPAEVGPLSAVRCFYSRNAISSLRLALTLVRRPRFVSPARSDVCRCFRSSPKRLGRCHRGSRPPWRPGQAEIGTTTPVASKPPPPLRASLSPSLSVCECVRARLCVLVLAKKLLIGASQG